MRVGGQVRDIWPGLATVVLLLQGCDVGREGLFGEAAQRDRHPFALEAGDSGTSCSLHVRVDLGAELVSLASPRVHTISLKASRARTAR